MQRGKAIRTCAKLIKTHPQWASIQKTRAVASINIAAFIKKHIGSTIWHAKLHCMFISILDDGQTLSLSLSLYGSYRTQIKDSVLKCLLLCFLAPLDQLQATIIQRRAPLGNCPPCSARCIEPSQLLDIALYSLTKPAHVSGKSHL